MKLYHFNLDFSVSPYYAPFPFIFEGERVPGISALISSRSAGNMLYSEGTHGPARLDFFRSLGLDPARVYVCTQVHSRRVLEVGRGTPDRRGPEADGLISRDRETVLSVTVADCLPVFLYDTGGRPEAGTGGFALVHSGWKGTGIALEALRLMEKSWHTRPGDIAAILGPCIRRCCYQVDDGRARAFEAGFGGTGGGGASLLEPAAFETGGKFFLDLQAANIRLLAGAGVRNIAVCEDCTFTDERLGSFRREGPGYTRMAALAGCFQ